MIALKTGRKTRKLIRVNFNPENKVTSKKAREIIEQTKKRIKRIIQEKRYKDKPGPDCISDKQILGFIRVHPQFYGLRKNQEIEEHLLSCDRCSSRAYWLLRDNNNSKKL